VIDLDFFFTTNRSATELTAIETEHDFLAHSQGLAETDSNIMDSQHRHELQENDLQRFIFHFRAWWDLYWRPVVLAISLVALVIMARRFLVERGELSRQSAQLDLATISNPEAAKTVARSYDDPVIKAQALLAGADLSLMRAVNPAAAEPVREGSTTTAPAVPAPAATSPAALIKTAGEMYKSVLALSDVNPVFFINARLGLAAVAEAQSDWPEAKAQYQQTIKLAEKDFPVIAAQARARLENLDHLQLPVTFAPAAPVTTAPPGPAAPAPALAP
jgi:hypothetical protein